VLVCREGEADDGWDEQVRTTTLRRRFGVPPPADPAAAAAAPAAPSSSAASASSSDRARPSAPPVAVDASRVDVHSVAVSERLGLLATVSDAPLSDAESERLGLPADARRTDRVLVVWDLETGTPVGACAPPIETFERHSGSRVDPPAAAAAAPAPMTSSSTFLTQGPGEEAAAGATPAAVVTATAGGRRARRSSVSYRFSALPPAHALASVSMLHFVEPYPALLAVTDVGDTVLWSMPPAPCPFTVRAFWPAADARGAAAVTTALWLHDGGSVPPMLHGTLGPHNPAAARVLAPLPSAGVTTAKPRQRANRGSVPAAAEPEGGGETAVVPSLSLPAAVAPPAPAPRDDEEAEAREEEEARALLDADTASGGLSPGGSLVASKLHDGRYAAGVALWVGTADGKVHRYRLPAALFDAASLAPLPDAKPPPKMPEAPCLRHRTPLALVRTLEAQSRQSWQSWQRDGGTILGETLPHVADATFGVVWEGAWWAHDGAVSSVQFGGGDVGATLTSGVDGLARVWDGEGRLLGTLDTSPRFMAGAPEWEAAAAEGRPARAAARAAAAAEAAAAGVTASAAGLDAAAVDAADVCEGVGTGAPRPDDATSMRHVAVRRVMRRTVAHRFVDVHGRAPPPLATVEAAPGTAVTRLRRLSDVDREAAAGAAEPVVAEVALPPSPVGVRETAHLFSHSPQAEDRQRPFPGAGTPARSGRATPAEPSPFAEDFAAVRAALLATPLPSGRAVVGVGLAERHVRPGVLFGHGPPAAGRVTWHFRPDLAGRTRRDLAAASRLLGMARIIRMERDGRISLGKKWLRERRKQAGRADDSDADDPGSVGPGVSSYASMASTARPAAPAPANAIAGRQSVHAVPTRDVLRSVTSLAEDQEARSDPVSCLVAGRLRARSGVEPAAVDAASSIVDPGSSPAAGRRRAGLASSSFVRYGPAPGLAEARRETAGPRSAGARGQQASLPSLEGSARLGSGGFAPDASSLEAKSAADGAGMGGKADDEADGAGAPLNAGGPGRDVDDATPRSAPAPPAAATPSSSGTKPPAAGPAYALARSGRLDAAAKARAAVSRAERLGDATAAQLLASGASLRGRRAGTEERSLGRSGDRHVSRSRPYLRTFEHLSRERSVMSPASMPSLDPSGAEARAVERSPGSLSAVRAFARRERALRETASAAVLSQAELEEARAARWRG